MFYDSREQGAKGGYSSNSADNFRFSAAWPHGDLRGNPVVGTRGKSVRLQGSIRAYRDRKGAEYANVSAALERAAHSGQRRSTRYFFAFNQLLFSYRAGVAVWHPDQWRGARARSASLVGPGDGPRTNAVSVGGRVGRRAFDALFVLCRAGVLRNVRTFVETGTIFDSNAGGARFESGGINTHVHAV